MSGMTKYVLVKLKDIEPTPDRPNSALARSISTDESLDSPPLLTRVKKGKYKYRVVFGRRRLNVLRDRGVDVERFLVVDSLESTDFHIVALRENSGTENIADEVEHVVSLIKTGLTRKQIATKTGYTYWRVRNRQDLGEKLHPRSLDALRTGNINKSAANNLMKLTFEEQTSIIDEYDGSPTVKAISKALRDKKIARLSTISFLDDPDPDIKPGLFFSGEDMAKALDGEEIVKDYSNGEYSIQLVVKKID